MHPTSGALLDKVTAILPHALLLSADEGVGLGTIARSVAKQHAEFISVVLPEKDDVVDIEKGSITVDSIRRLYSQTRTKHQGSRVIVIDYAERMSTQAQNAFLKLLEEPAEGTSFILASHEPGRLLPTILSRVQYIELRRITGDQSRQLLDTLQIEDATKRTQLLFMADGLPAELIRLHEDEDYFAKRVAIMRDARTLLQGEPFDKILVAHSYKDDRKRTLLLLKDAEKIIQHSLAVNPQPRLIEQLKSLSHTYDAIEANGNIRLQLAALVV